MANAVNIIHHQNGDETLLSKAIESVCKLKGLAVVWHTQESLTKTRNEILRSCASKFVIMMNDDCELLTDFKTIEKNLNETTGVLGADILTGSEIRGKIKLAGMEGFAVSGNFLVVRNAGIYFDEVYTGSCNHEDVDYCLRLHQSKYEVQHSSEIKVRHNRQFTKGKPLEWNNLYFRLKHPKLFIAKHIPSLTCLNMTPFRQGDVMG